MNDPLVRALKQLRLSGALQSLEVRLHEARSNQLSHAEFLELVVQDELVVRSDRTFRRRLKVAGFRELKLLDDFDPASAFACDRRALHAAGTEQKFFHGGAQIVGLVQQHGMRLS